MKIIKLNRNGFTSVVQQTHTKDEASQIAIAVWLRGYFNQKRLQKLMENKEGSSGVNHDLRAGIK